MLGGRYRLEDLLSEHDGARFWRATDTVLARSVAVHALASEDPRAPHVLDAARRSVQVTDPHYLRVLDSDDVDGLTWVINEWGEGVSLDVMLERGTLPPTRAAWLTREVAEAIAAAHAQGLHHGRLNPEAVLVTDAGSVKVIGFVVTAAFEGAAPVHPAYGPIGPREADVIDLAGILYAALTGRWPGVAPSAVPRAPRDGRRPLRPRQVRAGVPRTLDAICDRVLHKEAAQHALPIETAHEIAAALSDYVGDPAIAAPVDVPSMYDDPVTAPVEEPATQESVEASAVEAIAAALPAARASAPAAPPRPERVPEPAPEPEPEPEAAEADATAESKAVAVDPEATMAAPAPIWTEEHAEPEPWQPPPPPPPLADIPERPLFADHERRVPPGAPPPPAPAPAEPVSGPLPGRPSELTESGAGTGSGARYWPFEDPEDTGSFSGKEGRSWLQLAGIVALCIAVLVAMFVAFDIGRGDDDPSAAPTTSAPQTPTETGSPVQVVGAQDFDPEGDPPEENPDQVPLATDGKPGTGWRTLTYKDDARLGGLKSGVGILLDLGSEQEVGSVQLRLVGSPTDVELYATAPGVNDAPAELADTRRVAAATADGTTAVLRADPAVRTRFLVVWLTSLPSVTGGFRGEIAEVTVRS
jgi:serine/threonine protein kinase